MGCDHCKGTANFCNCKFQSTHPRGVRLLRFVSLAESISISIHAPTWGATYFIYPKGDKKIFQSTHPRGVRPINVSLFQTYQNFNPRTHVGCDVKVSNSGLTNSISIHAPTWGATPRLEQLIKCEYMISIHAPTWGATVKPSNGWLLGHKDNEFANENIIIINSVNIT